MLLFLELRPVRFWQKTTALFPIMWGMLTFHYGFECSNAFYHEDIPQARGGVNGGSGLLGFGIRCLRLLFVLFIGLLAYGVTYLLRKKYTTLILYAWCLTWVIVLFLWLFRKGV